MKILNTVYGKLIFLVDLVGTALLLPLNMYLAVVLIVLGAL